MVSIFGIGLVATQRGTWFVLRCGHLARTITMPGDGPLYDVIAFGIVTYGCIHCAVRDPGSRDIVRWSYKDRQN